MSGHARQIRLASFKGWEKMDLASRSCVIYCVT